MKLANSPEIKKRDRENSKTLKNFMLSQDEYLRFINKATIDIQCKFDCKKHFNSCVLFRLLKDMRVFFELF